MTTTAAVLFDDGQGLLGPLTDLRPSFAVRTGALTTRERLVRVLGLSLEALHVRPALLDMARSRAGEPPINDVPLGDGPLLLINGRCVLPPARALSLKTDESLIEDRTGHLVACVCSRARARAVLSGQGPAPEAVEVLPLGTLMSRPWHVRTTRDAAIDLDLDLLLKSAGAGQDLSRRADIHTFGGGAVFAAQSAKVYPGVIIDREGGAVFIDERAVIRPGCTIIGPAYIGRDSQVLDRAIIKAHTAIGPWCKAAGEVGGTIFHGFANKAHDGHLGDSWVGKWANLGAGTVNSNLLNTYAEVTARATPTSPTERTGHQFFGCVLGDHVKTAIGTRIMTGTIVHTGAMLAMTAPVSGCIPAFSWGTDASPPGTTQAKRFRADKFLDIARAVMARRKVEMSDEYARRVLTLWGEGEG